MLKCNLFYFYYISRELRYSAVFYPKNVQVQSNNPHQLFISTPISTFVKLKISLKQITLDFWYYDHVRNNWCQKLLEEALCQFNKRKKKLGKDDKTEVKPQGCLIGEDPCPHVLQLKHQNWKLSALILALPSACYENLRKYLIFLKCLICKRGKNWINSQYFY